MFLVAVSQEQSYRIIQDCKLLRLYHCGATSASDTALPAQVGTPTELFDSSEELVYSALIYVGGGGAFLRVLGI